MGIVKEPEGVDFVINSGPWTDEDRAEVSRYIKEYKLKHVMTPEQKAWIQKLVKKKLA